MKKILLPLLFIFSFTTLFAQPVNDDCSGLIDLGVIPFCPDSVWYTNVDATPTDIGSGNFPAGCDGGDINFVGRDVFFQFTTSNDLLDITVTVTGLPDPLGSTPMMNPQVAVYRGDCLFDELSLLKCGKAEDGSNIIDIDVIGLDPNTPYFIRVTDYSSSATPNSGTFQLCIDEQDPEFTVCDDSSVAPSGVLYDCGGPDGDYENNSTESFTICPDLLTALDGCITYSLQYFNIETGGGDLITFYDGPDTNSPIISSIGSDNFGGGGVCYVVQASSGCLTVELSSDATVVFEGFCGSWETSVMPCDPPDPIDVEGDPTDLELADFVTTPQSFATITNVDCASGQYGTFTADGTDLGLERGIVLTSGSINNTIGPNTDTGAGTNVGTDGDQDLDSLSILNDGMEIPSLDACIVELDVFVATNQLSFEYVFGSEEYSQFVNTDFNDIFALMVSGPGIVGEPGIGDQQNIAKIPGSNTEVSINNVNYLLNTEYYRNNVAGQSVEYNGLTSDFLGVKKSLTATIPVIPCTTYHLKFAIADRFDGIFDSGVFIGELEGDVPELSVNFASGVDYLVEDCTGTEDILIITLENPQEDSLYYDVVISGTATQGVDYTLDIPSQILIPAGVTELMYPLIPLTDGITEGIETISIQLTSNFGCGDIELNEIIIEIHDQPLVEIFAGADTVFVCSGSCISLEANGGVTYEWLSPSQADLFDDPFSPTPIACPTQSQWISVTGFISNAIGCNDVDSVYLQFIDPTIAIAPDTDTTICAGSSVELTAINNSNGTNLSWTPNDFLNADNLETVIASPPSTQTYIASINVTGCIVSDTITINVTQYDPPVLTTTDTTVCQGSPILLADPFVSNTTVYQWSPDTYLITDSNIAGAIAVPDEDITYTLISNTFDNVCADTFEVNVTVLPAEVSIDNGDLVQLCLGDSVLLTTTNSTAGVGITWFPDVNLNTTTGPQVWATPTETTQYFVELTVGSCTVLDSVTVRVDSLPNTFILAIPTKEVYCQGEIVNLVSAPYDPGAFPDMTFLWDPVIGQNSDVDNYNLNITATETFTYVRTTTNNACSSTDVIEIIVIDPTDLEITPIDTIVCLGEEVTLTGTSSMTNEFTWTNNTGAESSCPEDEMCPTTTIVTNNIGTIVTAVGEVQGCPVMDTVIVFAIADPLVVFPPQPQVCVGESIALNLDGQITTTYDWTTANGVTFSTDSVPVVSPTQTTTYYVTLDNQYCPIVNDSITVFVADLSTLTVPEDQVLCQDDVANLVAESNNLGTFVWSTGFTESSTFTSVIDYTSENFGVPVPITVTFDSGCPDTDPPLSETFNVTVQPNPGILLTLSTADTINEDCVFNEGDIVLATAIGQNLATYEWTINGQSSTSRVDTFVALNSGSIQLQGFSALGCPSPTIFKNFTVIPAVWVMPNAFTPDGDQTNDTFGPLIKGAISIVNFKIFNRWGDQVYSYEEGSTGWNGTFNGKPQPTDSYIYQIEILRPDGITTEKDSGNVTLIR